MATLSKEEQDTAILECKKYITHYAYMLKPVITPLSGVDYEDLVQIGLETLVKCAKKFDTTRIGGEQTKSIQLWRYASKYVLGAMVDELRRLDLLTRNERSAVQRKKYKDFQHLCMFGTPRQNTEAERLRILVNFDQPYTEWTIEKNNYDYFLAIQSAQTEESNPQREKMHEALATLTTREKMIMQKIYGEDKKIVDVAEELNITQGSAWVYHCEIKKKLKSAIAIQKAA